MTARCAPLLRQTAKAFSLLLLLIGPHLLQGQPTTNATASFNSYTQAVELRLARQHQSADTFLVLDALSSENTFKHLRQGEIVIDKLTPDDAHLADALLHHWRGTAFVPGTKAADFERLLRNFHGYPHYFSPQVLQAGVITQNGDRMQATMRLRQRHVLTVVLDATYDVTFGHLDARHGYSISLSRRISEIDGAGTPAEHVLQGNEEHGFLWRLNTYWSYEERDGGLYLQIEAVSLTRSIPSGVGWAIGPYVESIPRESLEFTLRSVCNALRR